jgi:hypothetical protein
MEYYGFSPQLAASCGIHCEPHRREAAVLLAAILIGPMGLAALLGFALIADKHLKDLVAMPRGHFAEATAIERRHERAERERRL